jgi:HD superfamily phosphohydrolase YqeK
VLDGAAAGALPAWTEAGPARRAHMGRVAELMSLWAGRLGLAARHCVRWRAAGMLHDALRDAPHEKLRPIVADPFRALPGSFLHGPAAAALLVKDGLQDDEVRDAIAYHTLGDAGLGRLGRALIAADYLEPARTTDPIWRATERARMPEAFDEVIRNVVAHKLSRALQREHPIRHEMIALWNSCVDATLA